MVAANPLTGVSVVNGSPSAGAGARTPAVEPVEPEPARCDLCGEPIPPDHRHLIDLRNRELMCACRPCKILFDRGAAGGGHYRLVPERRLALAYDMDGAGITDVFDFMPVGPGSFALGPFEVTLARTAHPVECYAIRLTVDGRSLVYTGDTGPSDAVVELARGADVLLAEAAHPPGLELPTELHLTGKEAGEHAAAAGVGRLLLTHVPPWHEPEGSLAEARSTYDGPIALARTGDVHVV